jgi:hypothetical protein
LVPPFSLIVYIYWIIWKLIIAYKNLKKVSPVNDNKDEVFHEKKEQDDKCNKSSSEYQVNPKKLNLISNWTNRSKFYGLILIKIILIYSINFLNS